MFEFKKLLLSLLLPLLLLGSHSVVAAPQAEYWSLWDKSNESNQDVIDHSLWDGLLASYAVAEEDEGIVTFRYGDMNVQAHKQLAQYIDNLEQIDPRIYSSLEQKAFWMNLYNALTVQAVTENLQTLKKADFAQPLAPEVWSEKRVKIASEKLSLNDIQHRILRPIWKDHRVLFGLNCATRDCPNLSPRAYTALNIKSQLSEAGQRFINTNAGLLYSNGVLHASRLFKEYMADFAADEKTLTKVFAHYARDMKALYVLGYTGTIDFTTDSRLNMPAYLGAKP
ncbi:MAG: DUF547 domain-containing protein [Porticoccaceae bacterium]|nr:DUF547 domain-containing protein [Porticoccaceae bacterium]